MADRPMFLNVAAFTVAVGSLVGLVSTGLSLLGTTPILSAGLLSWPGLEPWLTLGAFVGSALGLVTVYGLVRMRPWAPKLGGWLALVASMAGLVAVLVLGPIKGFTFPWREVLLWTAVIVAGLWLIHWCTHEDVVAKFAAQETFPTTGPHPTGEESSSE